MSLLVMCPCKPVRPCHTVSDLVCCVDQPLNWDLRRKEKRSDRVERQGEERGVTCVPLILPGQPTSSVLAGEGGNKES